jgi:hypothetical protein
MADGFLVSKDFLNRASRSIRKTERDPALRNVTRRVNWPDAGSCDCCPPCCGTLWYVVDDEIVWTADHFEGMSDYDLDYYFGSLGSWPYVNSCDEDASGYVYQGGLPSSRVVTNLLLPQSPMYTLRSYDSAGNLRWSWSDFPNGYSGGGTRHGPGEITKVRCGGDHIFTTQADISFSPSHTVARRHSQTDGSVVWQQDLTQLFVTLAPRGTPDPDVGFVLWAASPDLVLYAGRIPSDSYTAILVLNHDGTVAHSSVSNAIAYNAAWMLDNDNIYFALGTSPDIYGRMVTEGTISVASSRATISDTSFIPQSIKVIGDLLVATNGSNVNSYTIGGTGSPTHTITSDEKVLMLTADDAGTKDDDAARIRNSDLTKRVFFTPQTAADQFAFTDAMPTLAGSVWCGRRRCGVKLLTEGDTPTTTSTTSTSTTSTSTTTASTTSTTTGTTSTTTGSTTTGSTTTGSTTTGSTTTDTSTTGSTTTASSTTASSTTAACTGNCEYVATAIGTGSPTGFYWFNAANTCSSGCGCVSGDFETATAVGRWPADINDTASITCR